MNKETYGVISLCSITRLWEHFYTSTEKNSIEKTFIETTAMRVRIGYKQSYPTNRQIYRQTEIEIEKIWTTKVLV